MQTQEILESLMITEIGKELRKIRIDQDERLIDMAKRIGKSASFISAVEVGKKSPPMGFEVEIIRVYGLSTELANTLLRAGDLSRKSFLLEPNSAIGRDTAGLFARKINTLSPDDFKEIRDVLLGGSKKNNE